MPKLIDAEVAKEAINRLYMDMRDRLCDESDSCDRLAMRSMMRGLAMGSSALDALPDASEQAIHAERIPVPPHLAEAQRVVIKQAQQAGDGAEEK